MNKGLNAILKKFKPFAVELKSILLGIVIVLFHSFIANASNTNLSGLKISAHSAYNSQETSASAFSELGPFPSLTGTESNNQYTEQCMTLWVDQDGDGYSSQQSANPVCWNGCVMPSGYVTTPLGPDCNDNNNLIHSTSAAPAGSTNQSFCPSNSPTINSISITGSNTLWYDALTAGILLSTSTPLSDGTTYYASQTGINECESTNRLGVTVSLNVITSITTNLASSADACMGGTAPTLSIVAAGTGALHYIWYSNNSNSTSGGTPISSTDNSSYVPGVTTAGTYYYYVIVTGDCGSATSLVTTLTVNANTAISTDVTSQVQVCEGGSITDLTVVATGTGLLNYEWFVNSTNSTSGAISTGAYTINYTPDIYTPGTRYYYVVVTSDCGTATSGIAEVIVLPAFLATINVISDVDCSGSSNGSAEIVTTLGTAPFTYLWDFAGETTPIATSLIAGDHFATVTDANGCVAYPDLITIIEPDPLNASVSSMDATCSGNSDGAITISAPSGGSGNYQYSKDGGASWVDSGNFTGISAGDYVIQIRDKDHITCFYDLGIQHITEPAVLSAVIVYPNDPYCARGTAQVVQTGRTGGIYSSTSGLVINSITGDINLVTSTAGTYTVTYNYSLSSCAGSTTTTITIKPLPTATISYGASPYCASGTASVTRTGQADGTYSSTTGISIDSGTGEINLAASLPSGNSTKTYTITYTFTNNNCSSTTTGTITIKALPAPFTVTGGGSFCAGGSGVAVGLSNGKIGISYQLLKDGVNTGSPVTGTNSSLTFGLQNQAGVYTVEATDNTTSCSKTMTGSVTITANPQPAAPTGINGSVCISGTVTLSATTASGVSIDWYSGPTGGTALLRGSLNYTTPSISSPTTYYAEARNATTGCLSSTRTAVNATIDPTSVGGTATPTAATVCTGSGTTITLSGQTGTIQWQQSADGATGWANVTSGSGGTTDTYTTANLTGKTWYKAVVTSGHCSSTTSNTTSVSIDAVSVGGTASATAASICSGTGTTITLSGNTGMIQWQQSADGTTLWANVTGGSGATTATYTTNNLNETTYYQAVVTSGTCTSANSNSALVTVKSLPDAPTGAASQTYCSADDKKVSDLTATLTGTNIIWYDAATTGNVVAGTTTLVTGTTYYASQTVTNCESTARKAVAVTINTTPGAPTATAAQSFCSAASPTVANLESLTGSGIKWYNSETGGTLHLITDALVTATDYWATQTVDDCESSARVKVTATINTTPDAPTGEASQTYCSADNKKASDLTATLTGTNIIWYDAASTGNIVTETTTLVTGTTYYASQTVTNCESTARKAVAVTINTTPDAPTATAAQSFCSAASPTVANLESLTGSGIKWYNSETGGTLHSSTDALVTATDYWASQSVDDCESSARVKVTATINTTPNAPTGAASQTYCSAQDKKVSDLTATLTGTNMIWYDAATAGNVIAGTTTLVTGTTYYASQTVTNCESTARKAVAITVNTTPDAPTGEASQTYCSADDKKVSDLTATLTGTNIIWYDAATAGNVVAGTTTLVTGTTYYASQTVTNCESTARKAVAVTINTTPGAPTATAAQSFCSAASPTVANLESLTGSGIKWYNSETGGTLHSSTDALVTATDYWASQSVADCESSARVKVTATINTTPNAPTGAASQTYCSAEDKKVSDLTATLTGTNIIWYDAATNGNIVTETTTLVTGTTYYASQTVTNCESTARKAVAITVNTTPDAPTGEASQTYCSADDKKVSDLTATLTGTNIIWYDAATAGNVVAGTTTLVTETTYYASQTVTNCESTARKAVAVTINTTPGAPTLNITQPTCSSANGSVAITSSTSGLTFSTDGTTYSAYTAAFVVAKDAAYSITAKNSDGCISSAAAGAMGAQPATPDAPTVGTITQPTCSVATGSVILSGLPSGSWTINPGSVTGSSSSTTLSSLAVGTNNFTVTNSAGCQSAASANVVINSYVTVGATLNSTNLSCSGADGKITISNPTGGAGTYRYSKDGGTSWQANGGNYTGLSAGTYNVKIRDQANQTCITTLNSALVLSYTALSATVTSTNVTCRTAGDGTITVTAAGGSGAYQYSKDGGTNWLNNGGVFTGLIPATRDIRVRDKNSTSCIYDFGNVIITQPAALNATITATNVTCYNNGDGTATVNVSGGTLPYSYLWNDTGSQTTQTANSLIPGKYTVTVTDGNLCATTDSVIIIQPAALSATVTSTNVTCRTAGDGTITVTAAGGTGAYQYSINGGNSWLNNGGIFTGLAPATRDIRVRDKNSTSCIYDFGNVIITQPAALNATITATNVTCYNNGDGTATVNVSGGTLPYSYLWNDTGSQATQTANSLIPGKYTVTVTDGNLCVTTDSVIIIQPAALSATVTSTNVTCRTAGDGTITVTAAGGSGAYQYSKDGGANWLNNGGVFTGLIPSTHDVQVRDKNSTSCIYDFGNVIITQPAALNATITATNVTCYNNGDGTATVNVSGGTLPYSYLWNDTGSQATQTANSLIPGKYTVTVTDGNLCATTDSVTIIQPAALSATVTSTNVTCRTAGDGTITVTAAGGSGAYQYSKDGGANWLNNGGVFTGLIPSTHDVQVRDKNSTSCIYDFGNVIITQPAALNATITSTKVTCYNSGDGTATVNATGGTAPYSYLWNDPKALTTQTADSLSNGDYIVTITDGNNCSTTASVTIIQPLAPLSATVDSTNITCSGFSDGTITISSPAGGWGTYQYSRNGGTNWSNSGSFTGLAVSANIVLIRDKAYNSCVDTLRKALVITRPSKLNATVTSKNVSCFGATDGSIRLSNSKGGKSGLYKFSIDGGASWQADSSFVSLSPADYIVQIEDSMDTSCVIDLGTVTINQPASQLSATITSTDVTCFGAHDGTLTISNASGGYGYYQYSINGGISWRNIAAFDSLAISSHIVQIRDKDFHSCVVTLDNAYVISRPDSLSATLASTNLTCRNTADGTISITAPLGGHGSFEYTINGGVSWQATGIYTSLIADTYNVQIRDKDVIDCVKIVNGTLILTQPDVLLAPTSQDTTICSGQSATLRASGIGSISWYDAVTGGNWLHGGSNFTTPSLTNTTTYYAQDNTSCTTSTSRTAVVVTVNTCSPEAQDSLITSSGVQRNQFTASWNVGNGSGRIVFIKKSSTGSTTPTDGTTYSANTTFGLGTQIGTDGWFCIYNGTGSTVTVTGLIAGTDYIVQVFEYNGEPGSEVYNTVTAPNNPWSQTTDNTCLPVIEVVNANDAGPGSLRQAVLDLCDNGLITFHTSLSGGTITLISDELFVNKGMTIDGSSLATPVTISGNSAYRIFNILAPARNVYFNNFTVTNGSSANDGGAIYIVNADMVRMNSVTVSNSTSATAGGALYKLTSGVIAMNNCTFTGNSALWGAAIYLQEGVSTITGSTIDGNTAVGTGAAAGGIYQRNGYLGVTGSTISNNTAAAWGGAIYLENLALPGQPSLDLNGSILSGNTVSDGRGGGIYINNAFVNLANNTKIINNHVGHVTQYGDGGGIYMVHGTLNSNSSAIRGNTADNSGGGVYVFDTDAAFNSDGDSISTNTAVSYGGGVSVYNGNLNLVNGIVHGNISNNKGGGIYLWQPTGSIAINGSKFTANETKNGLTNDVNYGGALFITNAQVLITGSSFTGNTARRTDSNGPKGGAIYLFNGTLNIGGETSFTSNTTNTTQGKGGAIFNDAGTLINDPTVAPPPGTRQPNGNYPVPGISGPVNTRINFTSNTAGRSGGAIFTNQSTASTTNINCNFTSNTAARLGGAIYLQNGTLQNDNCLFESNSTTGTTGPEAGGAINHNLGTSTTKGSTFNNNGSVSGGAVYFKDGTASVVNSLFYGNTASANGGAIFTELSSANLTLTNSTLSANSATTSGGGLFNLASTAITVNNAIIWNNSSTGTGNQLSNSSGTAFVINNSDYGNSANDFTGTAPSATASITKDPLFVDAAGNDFRLKSDSPALDAGDNTKCSEPNDIRSDGFPRKLNKLDATSGTIDMGAYEYYFGVDPISDCLNPTNGGTIGSAQTICYGAVPSRLSSSALPTGQTGTLIYQWQYSTSGESNGFKNIVAADSSYLDSKSLTTTTWLRRLTRVGCKSNWSDSIKSNAIKVDVYDQFIAGTISSAQTICSSSTPAKLTGTDPTGGLSPFTYQWQSYSDSTTIWSNIVSASSLDYQPSALTRTKKYRQIQFSAASCGIDTTNEVTITVNALPSLFSVTGGGSYPAGGTGVAVGLGGSQIGVKYQLKVAGRDTLSSVRGNGSALSFGLQTSIGSYTVLGTDTTTTCSRTMTGSTGITTGPTLYTVIGGGSYCEGGNGVSICLSGSDQGVKYELRNDRNHDHNNDNNINSGHQSENYQTVTGTGSQICFGLITAEGTYTVYAKTSFPSTSTQMTGSAIITVNALPTGYSVTGGGAYCNGGSGVSIGLSDSKTGVKYQLKLGGQDAGLPQKGTGSSLSFGLQTAVGNYTVLATDSTTTCQKMMSGSVSVTINPLPTPTFTAQAGASACTGVDVTYTTQSGKSSYIWGIPGTVNTDYSITSGSAGSSSNTITLKWLTSGSKTVTINYSSSGCMAATATSSATTTVTVLPSVANISGGSATICVNATTTPFTDATASGTWSIVSGTGTASITNGGVVTGITAGTVTVTYAITNGGCSASATKSLTVKALPTVAAITGGSATVCVNSTTTAFTDVTSSGTWSIVSGTGTASITNSGVVTGITSGTVTVTYTVTSGGCSASATRSLTVKELPTVAAIAGGGATVCVNSTAPAFTNTTASGTWSILSGSGSASITSGGVVTGITPGTVTVIYTVTSGGCTASASKSITVNAMPTLALIASGAASVCVNSTTPEFTNVTLGGVWSIISVTGTASITSGGVVTGLTEGTVMVTYTVTSGTCTLSATRQLTINPLPTVSAIVGGAKVVCVNSATTAFTDATAGGTWSVVSGTGTASITSGGVVTGLTAGTVTVKYAIPTGCGNSATQVITVSALPGIPVAISGTKSVCVGSTTALSDATPSGVWSTSAPAIASISNKGIVTGISAGTTTIYYTVNNEGNCTNRQSTVITVNPLAVQPGAFTASASVVKIGTANVVYTVPNVAGMIYTWSYSGKGATITGTTNSVKISFATTATSGTLSVKATNGCGTSSARTIAIITNNNQTRSDTLIVMNPSISPDALNLNNEFKVYPNPSSGPAIFEFRIGVSAHVKLDIFSINGSRMARVYEGDVEAGIPQTALFEQYLPSGIYPCVLQYNGKLITLKLVVRHY